MDAELAEKLGDVRYWYQRDGRRIAKVVSFFLLEYARRRASTTTTHEVEDARWIAARGGRAALTYKGEREMARARAVADRRSG